MMATNIVSFDMDCPRNTIRNWEISDKVNYVKDITYLMQDLRFSQQ
jgi:hypothetical protein